MTAHPDLSPDRVAALRTSLGLEVPPPPPAPRHARSPAPPHLRALARRAAGRGKRAIGRVVRAARARGRR